MNSLANLIIAFLVTGVAFLVVGISAIIIIIGYGLAVGGVSRRTALVASAGLALAFGVFMGGPAFAWTAKDISGVIFGGALLAVLGVIEGAIGYQLGRQKK